MIIAQATPTTGMLDARQLQLAREALNADGRLQSIATSLGVRNEEEAVHAVAAALGMPVVDLTKTEPDAVAKARQELERIQQESSSVDQEIIEAHDRVAKNEAKLATLKDDVAAQEQRVADLSAQLGDVGALQMQTDSVSLTAQLLTSSDASSFLSGLGALQVEADRSNAGIQQLQVDQAKLTTLREDADATQAQLEKDAATKVELGEDYEKLEADAKAVYDRLSEEERQRLAAEQAERERRAAAAQFDTVNRRTRRRRAIGAISQRRRNNRRTRRHRVEAARLVKRHAATAGNIADRRTVIVEADLAPLFDADLGGMSIGAVPCVLTVRW